MRRAVSRLIEGLALVALVGSMGVGTARADVIQITQARAITGGVTPGDTPGFPVIISRPGSYRLMTNLVLPSTPGTVGVDITAEGVTLDLNGFAVIGPRVCADEITPYCPPHIEDASYYGIRGTRNTTVTNGTVRGMPGQAVSLGANARIERVNVIWSSLFGIIAGRGSIIKDSRLAQNGYGAFVGDESQVTGCVFRANIFTGLQLTGANAGYGGNVFVGGEPVSGGAPIGPNLCNGGLCP